MKYPPYFYKLTIYKLKERVYNVTCMSKYCPLGGYVVYLDCLECEVKSCMKKQTQVKPKCIIGIDQSYKRTGMSVASQNALCCISSIELYKLTSNTQKRLEIASRLSYTIEQFSKDYIIDKIIIERIRLRSQGFLNIDYIKSIGALNAVIVDTANKYNIPVFSVDTRAWKSKVVGTCKPKENKYGVDPHKWPTLLFIKNLGFTSDILVPAGKKKKGVIEIKGKKYTFNDDAADSACIALYGFLPENKQNLKEEH